MDEVKTAIWLEGFYIETLGQAARLGLPPIDRKAFLLLVAGELATQASRDKMAV
jgi:hypothetical protein